MNHPNKFYIQYIYICVNIFVALLSNKNTLRDFHTDDHVKNKITNLKILELYNDFK